MRTNAIIDFTMAVILSVMGSVAIKNGDQWEGIAMFFLVLLFLVLGVINWRLKR